MKAICPVNANHKHFRTIVHVTEEWLVNEIGKCIMKGTSLASEVIHGPDASNIWTCFDCDSQAEIVLTDTDPNMER